MIFDNKPLKITLLGIGNFQKKCVYVKLNHEDSGTESDFNRIYANLNEQIESLLQKETINLSNLQVLVFWIGK